MSEVLLELIDVLKLERIEENIFRGQSQDLGWGRVFGGQVLGQALSAAEQTVPPGRAVHSLHGYFLRPGDATKPIVFTVDPIRDGRSFHTRRVVAVQNGEAIFSLSASFNGEEGGLDHQSVVMPDVPGPEELRSEQELGRRYLERVPAEVAARIPVGLRERIVADRPIEIRPIDPIDPMKPGVREPTERVWFRANGKLPDEASLHHYMLAYASDFHLLSSTMRPHGVTWLTPGMQVASIDHAMWWYRPFRMDEWLLYDIESPTARGSRGLARGRWFTSQGALVAETMQEGLIRDRRG